MSAANYPACLAITLDYEGGYCNDAGDPGGPTIYGITIIDVRKYLNPSATAADVKALTLDQAKAIYRRHYWQPVAGDAWPAGLDLCVFDAAVNSGTGRADKWAQYALNSSIKTYIGLANLASTLSDKVPAIKKYNARRLSFLHGLRTWTIFGKGWGRRVAGIEALGVKMALQDKGLPSPQITERMRKEAAKADAASKRSTGGAVATGGGAVGGGGLAHADWSTADIITYLLLGVGGLVAVVLLIHFLWRAYANHQRAQAYQAAAAAPVVP